MTIVGDIYDIMLDNHRILDRNQINTLWVARKLTLPLGHIPPASTVLFRIFHNYIAVDQRWDPKPIHLAAEPTQGVLLHSLGAKGVDIQESTSLIEEEEVYHVYDIKLLFGKE